MISFKEFLSSQADRLRAEQEAHAQAKERWVQSVVRLIEQIENWIKESDPHQLVQLEHSFRESRFTTNDVYANAKLDVVLGTQRISIRPVVMNVLGPRWKPGEGHWAGLVEISGDSDNYELYRFIHDDNQEQWYVRNTRDYQMKVLDRASFDAALVDLFS